MCTSNELNRLVREIAKIYQSVYMDNLVKVILYGSYARGNYTSESDVDIVAIVRGSREVLQKQLKKYGKLLQNWNWNMALLFHPL